MRCIRSRSLCIAYRTFIAFFLFPEHHLTEVVRHKAGGKRVGGVPEYQSLEVRRHSREFPQEGAAGALTDAQAPLRRGRGR